MDFVEVEGKTYEEAVRKAATELNETSKTSTSRLRKSIRRVSLACSGARRFALSRECTASLRRRAPGGPP